MHYKESGQMYEGTFINDMKDGCGYLVFSDGRVYCGQFKKDYEEGVGEYLASKDI